MTRSSYYQLRLSEKEKTEAFTVFRELGLTPAQAFRLFLDQVIKTQSIPFPIRKAGVCPLPHVPNAQLAHDLLKPDSEKGYQSFASANDLFADLND